jgi:hypothetical protein
MYVFKDINKFFEIPFRRRRDNRFILMNAFVTGCLLHIPVDAAIGAGPFAANAYRPDTSQVGR